MKNNRFRQGRSVFVCGCCGRRTRETGQPIGSDCCPECYELAGLQNTLYDGCATIAEIAEERDRLLSKAVRQGSDAARIKRAFSNLWEHHAS